MEDRREDCGSDAEDMNEAKHIIYSTDIWPGRECARIAFLVLQEDLKKDR